MVQGIKKIAAYPTELHIVLNLGVLLSNCLIYPRHRYSVESSICIHGDRMHLVKDIIRIIFGLQFLQTAQIGTVDVRNSRITSYNSQNLA